MGINKFKEIQTDEYQHLLKNSRWLELSIIEKQKIDSFYKLVKYNNSNGVYYQYYNKYAFHNLFKLEDDYFILTDVNNFYLCDQFYELLRLLNYLKSENINESKITNFNKISDDEYLDLIKKSGIYLDLTELELNKISKIPNFRKLWKVKFRRGNGYVYYRYNELSTKDNDNYIKKLEDDYYIVRFRKKFYLCDQFAELKKLLTFIFEKLKF